MRESQEFHVPVIDAMKPCGTTLPSPYTLCLHARLHALSRVRCPWIQLRQTCDMGEEC